MQPDAYLLNTYQFIQYVIPAGIAGIQKPGMARLRSHPCVLDTGSPCRYDVLFKQSDR
jgi:hypothetical protein